MIKKINDQELNPIIKLEKATNELESLFKILPAKDLKELKSNEPGISSDWLKQMLDPQNPERENIHPSILSQFDRLGPYLFNKDGYSEESGAVIADILLALVTAYRELLTKQDKQTFAMPSHDIMLTLITLFAGKPARIPRTIIDKPAANRTPEEQQQVTDFINSIIQQETSTQYTDQGQEEKIEKFYALVSDNPKVKAIAEIEGTLWGEDKLFQQEALGVYIKRTFGPEGMRHLLAFLIGFDEAGRSGNFIWRVNEHLERMGKEPNKIKRAFKTEDRETAIAILKTLISLNVTAEVKQGRRGNIRTMKLFMPAGYDLETFDKNIINVGIDIQANNLWYRDAFLPPSGKAPQFTKLLKKIAQENHRNHPLTLSMAPLFAIMWRANGPEGWKISIENLMKWCDQEPRGKYGADNYKDLIAELDYMKHAGYLGDWVNKPNSQDRYKSILTLTPPDWFNTEMAALEAKKEVYLSLPPGGDKPLSPEEFNRIYKASGLSQSQFGNHVGVSGQAIGKVVRGARPSKQLSIKIRAAFPDLVIKNDNQCYPS